MKKALLSAFSALLAIGASANGTVKSLAAPHRSNIALQSDIAVNLNNSVTALFDDTYYKVPNYYIILSDNENASYNNNTGEVNAPTGSYILTLDLYNQTPEDGLYLPAGTYNPLPEGYVNETPFSFTTEFSFLDRMDASGRNTIAAIENPIEVKINANGQYTITTTVNVGSDVVNITFNGPIKVQSAYERPTIYPQIKRDLDVTLDKGGISYYQGVTDISSQGVSYFDLYGVDFNEETGYMNDEGFNLCMMIAHKRFTKRADYAVCPGTYTQSNGLLRNTWYPAREIDYMGYVVPFGSYIREMKVVDGQRTYTYAYLKSGEFTIEDNGDGTYKGTLNAVSDLGYTIKATWSGKIALNTDNATFQATVSDLKDDVAIDFSPLEVGRIYHHGVQGGCRTFVVDLGSPVGQDAGVNYGGDILRMEFLVEQGKHLLEPGLYTVVPRRWNSNELIAGGTYEPMSLNKGYFDGNGAQIGTRYAHFREGSYCVYDMVGPAEEGTVRVETTDYINYTFDIDLRDDAGFMMTGYWDNKPLIYGYDAEALRQELSGIDEITGEESVISAVIEGDNLFVMNAGNAPVAVYSIDGRLVASTTADKMIPVSQLGKGLFIIKAKTTSIKITL